MEKGSFKIKCDFVQKGIPASPGIAIAKVFLLEGDAVKIDSTLVDQANIEIEVNKFKEAVDKAKDELKSLQRKVARRIGQESAKIFDVHQLLLEDDVIIEETIGGIRKEYKSADHAFFKIMQQYQETLSEHSTEFFQSRVSDIRDVKRRVIRHIQGDRTDYLNKLEGSAAIVAKDLTPSDAVVLERRKILGFATDAGGRTSHVAIMARSMDVPAVVGLRRISMLVAMGDRIIIDGTEGKVLIRPDEKTIKHYRALQEKHYDLEKKLDSIRDLPAITQDGKKIELASNLEFIDEIESVKSHGGRGIGLYRTDYLYLTRTELPNEEEQLKEYAEIVKRIAPLPVVIRTMDLGGDKHPTSILIPPEDNPFLGWRAIRISLERKEIFHAQLRAILRASAYGNVKILFPMISSIDEVIECRQAVERAKADLSKDKLHFDSNIELGVMIEVPSAALIADRIAKKVDFLSIGTNDLVQYVLAVDRGNERIAYLYKHLHPAVLRILKQIIQAGHEAGVWVGMCGEMASDPLATLILLGFGLDEFSVTPTAVPEIKNIIRSVTYREAVKTANKALQYEKASDIERLMTRLMRKKFKDLII